MASGDSSGAVIPVPSPKRRRSGLPQLSFGGQTINLTELEKAVRVSNLNPTIASFL